MDEEATVDPVAEAQRLPPASSDPGVQLAEAERDAGREADRAGGLPPAQAPDLPPPAAGGGSPDELKARIDAQVQAREDLKDKLEVVSDDQTGGRMPNQVTAAEYDDTAARLGDVQTGNNDLKVGIRDDPNLTGDEKRDYAEKVRQDLVENAEVASGREQLRDLTSNPDGKTTTIEVARETASTPDGRHPACHGEEDGRKHQDPASPPDANNATVVNENKPDRTAQDATIKYVPGATVDVPSSESTSADGTAPTPSHAILQHEGTHAVETTAGKIDRSPMTSGDPVDLKGPPNLCDPDGPRQPIDKAEESALRAERRYREEKRMVGRDLADRPRYYEGDAGNRPMP